MKRKCEYCQGKGGVTKMIGPHLNKQIFLACIHCKGKGKWYTNQNLRRSTGATIARK